ncbi:FAD-linked oxidase C-terminal domain-containing protein [Streptomyces sp. UG1]|uniref:FAD-linked oxidase C-terminal domain-containing protein n=1 Tax=Streptomyces sp. UG1 TaxID=3417652 RepID=UPI003CF7C37E
MVLADGTVTTLGGDSPQQPGYDLLGAFTGSEGTLGVITKVVVRLLPRPETVSTVVADFPTVAAAGDAVTAIIAAGIVPAAIEMMDNLAVRAVEAAVPADTAAALVIELDGPADEVTEQFDRVLGLCRRHGSTKLRVADDPAERELIWTGRKAAFAAAGRLSPDYIVQDGVVPRGRLGEVLVRIAGMADEAGLRVANVFHAGDGNLHLQVLLAEHRGHGAGLVGADAGR